MTRFLSLRTWPAVLGLALLLTLTGAVWAASPEAAINVTSCAVNAGWVASTCGGTSVSIGGSGFDSINPGVTVKFNAVAATSVTVVDANNIVCTTPAGSAGGATIEVINPDLSTSGPVPGFYTYVASATPTVTLVGPNTGSTLGGTNVTVTGTGFTGADQVFFGANPATGLAVQSDTSVKVTSPAGAVATVDITVHTCFGTSTLVAADQFTYTAAAPPPTVSTVTANNGSTNGCTAVVVTGTDFLNGGSLGVSFGGSAATSVVFVNATTINCTTPPHAAGAVNVVVTNGDGQTGTLSSGFTYNAALAPTLASVTVNTGPTAGGTAVTLTGTNFANCTGLGVKFGIPSATSVVFVNSTTITCTTPAHVAGAVTVTVTNPDGQAATLTNGFTYTGVNPPPTVTAISPLHGPEAGGTPVTITGTNFVSGTGLAVFMGATTYPCTGVAFANSTTITAVTPAHPPGTTTVGVQNPDLQQGYSSTPLYTYDASPAPAVTGVSPNSGPVGGGTPVTITGTNFTGATAVTFGGTSATSIVVVNATSITCSSPIHAAGLVDVTVTTPNGTSPISAADHFTYIPCTLDCTATVPTSGQTNVAVQFAATATPSSCTGSVTYAWTFGDTATSTEQNPQHTYTSSGIYSWSMTATIGTTICQKNGSISILTPPIISLIKKMPNPFRLKIMGLNFHPDCTVKVNGVPVPLTVWKSSILVIAKKGNPLKALLPAGQTVQITITNNDDGGVSTPYAFTR